VAVASYVLVYGTRVQEGAAPDAEEDFGLLAAEHAAAAVVDEHDVQLVGPVRLLAAPGAREDVRVDRQILARGAAGQYLEHRAERWHVGHDAFDAHHRDVHFRQCRHEPTVALVRADAEAAGCRHAEVHAADAEVGRE